MASQSSPFEGMLVPPQGLPEPPSEKPLQCPRCDSSNTKFCYYNNYSLSQPRHFCKSCRRYWTKGGSLRNVPVGGGCRKSNKKRPSKKAAHFAVNSALADLAAAGLASDPVASCGGFPRFIGSTGSGIFLQTAENRGFLGRGIVGDGGGGIFCPCEEPSAKIESFSGGGRGSQQVSLDVEVGSGSSSEGWAGLDTPTCYLDGNNLEGLF